MAILCGTLPVACARTWEGHPRLPVGFLFLVSLSLHLRGWGIVDVAQEPGAGHGTACPLCPWLPLTLCCPLLHGVPTPQKLQMAHKRHKCVITNGPQTTTIAGIQYFCPHLKPRKLGLRNVHEEKMAFFP